MGPGPPRGEALCPGSQSRWRQSQEWDTSLLIFSGGSSPRWSAAVQILYYTGMCFPLGADEHGRVCGVVLSELDVPCADEMRG